MSAPEQKPARILVVEDEPGVRQILQTSLAGAGFDVAAAESGAAALAQLEAGNFDALVTDEFMPQMKGSELVVQAHARWPALPIVMFVGAPPLVLPVGVTRYLHKPDDFARLPTVLRQLIQARPRG